MKFCKETPRRDKFKNMQNIYYENAGRDEISVRVTKSRIEMRENFFGTSPLGVATSEEIESI